MLYFEKGDIVTGDYPLFCQQVNCKGKMNAGLAGQIRSRYPEVYLKYYSHPKTLGKLLIVHTSDDRICINMYAQDGYGRDRRYTDYEAFQSCLDKIRMNLITYRPDGKIAFPYKIGCGLAGGDWKVILKMLQDFSELIDQDVVIVER